VYRGGSEEQEEAQKEAIRAASASVDRPQGYEAPENARDADEFLDTGWGRLLTGSGNIVGHSDASF